MLEAETMRANPFRSYGPPQLNASHDASLAYAKTVTERPLPEPYPQKHEQPVGVAFVPSEITFDGTFLPASRMIQVNSGTYAGKVFTQLDRPTHWLLVLEKISRKERRTCDNDAKTMVTLSAVSNSDF